MASHVDVGVGAGSVQDAPQPLSPIVQVGTSDKISASNSNEPPEQSSSEKKLTALRAALPPEIYGEINFSDQIDITYEKRLRYHTLRGDSFDTMRQARRVIPFWGLRELNLKRIQHDLISVHGNLMSFEGGNKDDLKNLSLLLQEQGWLYVSFPRALIK
jgi:hypothetical protein